MEEENLKKIEEKKELTRGQKLQIAFFIVMILAIIAMVVVIVIMLKNVAMFQENPIAFGIKQYNLDSCMCRSGESFIEVTSEGFYIDKKDMIDLGGLDLGAGRGIEDSGEE